MGGQLPGPDECNSALTSAAGEGALTPNPGEWNSTLASETCVPRNHSPVQNSAYRRSGIFSNGAVGGCKMQKAQWENGATPTRIGKNEQLLILENNTKVLSND